MNTTPEINARVIERYSKSPVLEAERILGLCTKESEQAHWKEVVDILKSNARANDAAEKP